MKIRIDRELQRLTRRNVEASFTYQYFGKNVNINISSDNGLKFNNNFDSFHNVGFIKNKNNYNLFYQIWLQDKDKPLVVFFHGSAENSSTHPLFVFNALSKGYNVISFDQEGYGSSDGIRGTFRNNDDYIQNTKLIIDKSELLYKEKFNKMPSYIFTGSSAGCAILLYFYLKIKPENVIKIFLFSPYLKIHKRVINPIANKIIGIVKFKSFPLMREDSQRLIYENDQDNYLNMNKNISDNKHFLINRFKDTRIHRINSLKWLSAIIRKQNFIYYYSIKKKHECFNIPVYCFISENDLIVDNKRTFNFMKNIGQKKNLFRQAGFSHEFLEYQDKRGEMFYTLLNLFL